MSRPIGLLLRTLDRLIDDRFEHAFGARGITRRQWQLLNALPGTLTELTVAMPPGEPIDPGPLVETGVVRREGDLYSLTAEGEDLRADLAHDVRTIRDRTVAGLPDGEYQRTVATLEAMIANLRF